MRILIITHSPLSAEFGAGQIAINLADALTAQGHEVVLWSPHPLKKTKWWRSIQQMRSKADSFIAGQKPFDMIDCPPTLITRRMCRSSIVVARSTQPDFLYLGNQLASVTRKKVNLSRLPFNFAYSMFHLFLVLQGWRMSDYILCLGSLELQWMRRKFPWWRGKLISYVNALSASDQAALAAIRRRRKDHPAEGIRFLWIGRWTSHKGTDVLLEFINDWSNQRPQDSFTVAGCGTEAEKDCPSELIKAGRLRIIPSFTREELYTLLTTHDAGLFTSKVEGWGLSLNEMLESGMRVFASRAGGTVDLEPFFNTLCSFPPTAEFATSAKELELPDEYYTSFSWPQIARAYIASISTSDEVTEAIADQIA